MKPVIMDMREMSLSKEVYDKKPGKFFAGFIYGLFVLLAVSFVWAYFGRIDVVVRAHGIIRPHTQTAVVLNAIPGEVIEVRFYEGKIVSPGDILFALDTFLLENERQILSERMETLEFELKSFELYRDSIDTGINLIGHFNNELSVRFDNFLLNSEALEHGAFNFSRQLGEDEAAIVSAIEYAEFELRVLQAFAGSVTQGSDMFGSIEAAVQGRNHVVLNSNRSLFNHYRLEVESLNFQITNMDSSLRGLQTIRDSLNAGYSLFSGCDLSIYRSMFDEHIRQNMLLQDTQELEASEYKVYAALYEVGVISYAELQAARIRLDRINARLTEHDADFVINIAHEIRSAEYTLARLRSEAEILRASTLAGIGSRTVQLESSISDMYANLRQLRVQQDTVFIVDEQVGDAVIARLSEMDRTLGHISSLENEINRLNLSIAGLDAQINDSTVRAPIYGEVNVHTELTVGSFIPGGVQILSVIPTRDDMLNANIFVSNSDIGRISEGMIVRYEISALPRRDFGGIYGTVTRIAADISTEQWVQGYFLVESEVEDRAFYDTRGNASKLRVGMGFEARIIVEEQRILFFLLDRLNLLIN